MCRQSVARIANQNLHTQWEFYSPLNPSSLEAATGVTALRLWLGSAAHSRRPAGWSLYLRRRLYREGPVTHDLSAIMNFVQKSGP